MTMELSMSIALVAALVIGEFFTVLVIVFFVLVAEVLEGLTVGRSRRAIKDLLPAAEAVLRQTEAPPDSALHQAAAIELVLETLHVHDKLSKFTFKERTFYKR